MPSSALLEQFLALLTNSPKFGFLSPKQQAELKTIYAGASDAQLNEAIEFLQKDAQALEQEQAKIEKLAQTALVMKNEIRQLEREELRDNDAKDREVSTKAAEELLKTLETIAVADKPKRKKFLGIF